MVFFIPFSYPTLPTVQNMMKLIVTSCFSWFRPARYTTASALCSFGGFLLGCVGTDKFTCQNLLIIYLRCLNSMDTSVIGPVTAMKTFVKKFGELSPAIHGLLVSSILLCAALSSVFAGKLADRLGRPQAMALGASVFALGTGLEAAAIDLWMFAVGRVIEGIGYGLYFSTQTVYICEISPPKARGPLTSGPQFMTCVALVVGYFTSYATVKIPSSLSWRLPYTLLTVMAIIYVLINLTFLPQSPRWLMRRQEYSAAEKVWDKLGVKQADREANSDSSLPNENETTGLEVSSPQAHRPRKHTSFHDLWTRDVRKQTFLAVFLLGFLQLCGIDAVLYVGYAHTLLVSTGLA